MIERNPDTAIADPADGGCACGAPVYRPATLGAVDAPWADGVVSTRAGDVPRVRTKLDSNDRLGAFKARVGVGRMDCRVAPGLYAAGDPDPGLPVLVSANYKLSFDRLRGVLADKGACMECGACAKNCVPGAITPSAPASAAPMDQRGAHPPAVERPW